MKRFYAIGLVLLTLLLFSPAHAETVLFETGWESGHQQGSVNRVEYRQNVEGYFNTSDPPPECGTRTQEIVHTGNNSLMIAGYSQAHYSYCYYHVFDLNLKVVPGVKIGYWIYHSQGTPKLAVDGHFTDGSTIRDLGGQALRDQHGVSIHPALRQDPMNQWYYVEMDLTPAKDKTIAFLIFAFDNGGDGFMGQYRAYVDDLKIFVPDSQPGAANFQTGWEEGEAPGLVNRVQYKKVVPDAEAYRVVGFSHEGGFSYLVGGTSQGGYDYCYFRVFDVNIQVVDGMKIGYWIYHSQGTPKVAVDGHFTDGSTIRDFGGQALRDQHGVQIHPALRQDPMTEWYYVEVDLSIAKNKTLDYVMFAFDNGGNNFRGRFEAYIDDFKVFVGPSQQPNCPQENVPVNRWRGEYFNNKTLSGSPVMVREDGDGFLDFAWELGSPNVSCVPVDRFSVRWTRVIPFNGGRYEFTPSVDDGFRLYIDGQLMREAWLDQGETAYPVTVDLTAGNHTVVLEYYENGGYATARLSWREVSGPQLQTGFYNDALLVPTTPSDDGWFVYETKSVEKNRDEIALVVDPSNGAKAQLVREHLAQGKRVVLLVCGLGSWGTIPTGWERPITTYANDYLDAVVIRVNYGIGNIGYVYALSFNKGVDHVTQLVLKAHKAGSNQVRLYGHSEGSDVSAKVVAVMASPTNRQVHPRGLTGTWNGQGNPGWFEGGFGFGNPADVGLCTPTIPPLPPVCIGLTSAAAPPPYLTKFRGGFFRYTGEYNGNYYGNKYVLFNRRTDPANTGLGYSFLLILGTMGTSAHDYRGVFSLPEFMAEYEAVLNPALRPANDSSFLWGDGAYVDRDAGERFDFVNVHWIPYIPGSQEMSQTILTVTNNPPNGPPTSREVAHVQMKFYESNGSQIGERRFDLEENASQEITNPLGASAAGTGVLFTYEQVGVVTRYNLEDGNRYYSAAYPSESYPSRTLYVPFLAKAWKFGRNDWRQTTELILFNPNLQEAQVELTYYNGTPGTAQGENRLARSIPGHGMLRLTSMDLPLEWNSNDGVIASAVVRSNVPLAGMVRNLTGYIGSSTGTVYTQFSESNYRIFTTRGSKKIFAPFVKASPQDYETFLYVQNTSDQSVNFAIRLYGNGRRWDTIPAQSLPPLGMKVLPLSPYVSSDFVGNAVLEVASPSTGTLALAVQLVSAHGAEAHEGIPDGTYWYQKKVDIVQLPVVLDQRLQSDAQWDSEINVINTGSTGDTATIKYYQPDGGQTYASPSKTMNPEFYANFSNPNDLPDSVPPQLFSGSAVVEGGRDQKRLGAAVEIKRMDMQSTTDFHDITMGYSAWW